MSTKTNSGTTPNRRKTQLDAVLIQLSSQRPSDLWKGMDQARRWLKESPEDQDVYGLLLDAVAKNRELRDRVRNIFLEMMQSGSESAEKALLSIPSSLQEFLADADDAYYAAEYERAIELYRQVLKLDAENARAKDQLAKAEIARITEGIDNNLPRVAVQYYRRARSYIAARDVLTAMNLLNAALEAAQGKGMKYPEADEALNNMQNLLTADEFKQKAKLSLVKEQWKEAVDFYNKALTLDPTNDLMKRELDRLKDLLRAETELRKGGIAKIFTPLIQWQNTVNTAKLVMNPDNPLLNFVEKKLNQIRLIRWVSLILLFTGISFILYISGTLGNFSLVPVSSNTPTSVLIPTNTLTASVNTATETPQPVIPIFTATDLPTKTPTNTLTSTPTEVVLGVGFINKATASTWQEPNSLLIERLGLNHPVTILEEREVSGDTWYRCRWESNGSSQEGWILSSNITFGTPPT